MKRTFESLGLKNELVLGLEKSEITVPTEIQHAVIPLGIENMDIIGQSPTGSGKTLAYLLPIFQRIDAAKRELQAIILAPTHELSHQIKHEIELLGKNSGMEVTSAAINGEANITRQIETIKKRKPHIVVGSTGRILELIQKKKLKPHTAKTIVIDECDKMFGNDNLENVKAVIKSTLKDRQIMAFSASVNDEALNISKELMKSPKKIFVESSDAALNIQHVYIESEQRKKFKTLRKALAATNAKRSIIFLNRNELIQDIESQLRHHNFKVTSLFGNASKMDRRDAVKALRNGKIDILVSSDLAARGLDIKGVTHVFNLDIAEDLKEYLHRAGRTGRAGKAGTVVSITTENELKTLKKIAKEFDLNLSEGSLSEGNIVIEGDKVLKKVKTKKSGNGEVKENRASRKNKYPKGFKSDSKSSKKYHKHKDK